jgi:D-proline reductase (dithiol) PrdB
VSDPRPPSGLTRLIESLRAEVDPAFEFASPGPSPWSAAPPAAASLSVALITTAGLHLAGDEPFADRRLGDTTFRIVPRGTEPERLDLLAPYVDRRYIPGDPEVALPLQALEALHELGHTGPPAPRHFSFSGGIVRPLPGLLESAARIAAILEEDGAGTVILLPSCSLCVQTVCLLAREIEARGTPTVALTLIPELTRLVGAPRALSVRFPFGAPAGDPGNSPLHQAVLLEALRLLVEATEPGTVRDSALAWRRSP